MDKSEMENAPQSAALLEAFMGGLVIVGISIFNIGFLVVFFAALCRESHKIRHHKIIYLSDDTGVVKEKDSLESNSQQSSGVVTRIKLDIEHHSPQVMIHRTLFERL